MFVKLACKNIKRSIKDYAIYFFTLVLGVAIFYVFNALGSQAVMLDVSERVKSMFQLLDIIMGTVSVFISFILGALIIYAARFLIKRRSKEFGVYLTLGMSKRKISLILLIETFLIGLMSLMVGLALGILASQLVSVLVANTFDANLTEFHFVFSASALIKTLVYFGIIYIIVMLFNTVVVSRQKLINLLSNGQRNEKIKLKNLWLCTFVFIIAAVMLGIAYYLVTSGLMTFMNNENGPQKLLIPIVMGVVATFLLFWSLSGILLRIFMSLKKIYYKGLNSFVLRQFSSQINTTVISMSLICLMLFVTICVLCSASSISTNLHATIEKNLPVDVQVTSIGRGAMDIEEAYKRDNVNLDELIKDIVTYHTYAVDDVTIGSTLGSITTTISTESTEVSDQIVIDSYDMIETFIHLSDYNRVAKIFELPELELAADQYAILANYQPIVQVRNQALAAGEKIKVLGQVLSPKDKECIIGAIELEMSNLNAGIIIVPDNINLMSDQHTSSQREILLANYIDPEAAEAINQKLYSLNNRFFNGDDNDDDEDNGGYYDTSTGEYVSGQEIYYYNVEAKQSIIDNNIGTSALVTFIGLYIGIIFLISSAAILALKQLSESSDNRDKYSILRKIGASNSMLNRALFWQIFIFFLFPLLIAILHSVFGLMFCDFILSAMGGVNITQALPYVSGILLVIYGGYFLITYFCSRSMIREQRR